MGSFPFVLPLFGAALSPLDPHCALSSPHHSTICTELPELLSSPPTRRSSLSSLFTSAYGWHRRSLQNETSSKNPSCLSHCKPNTPSLFCQQPLSTSSNLRPPPCPRPDHPGPEPGSLLLSLFPSSVFLEPHASSSFLKSLSKFKPACLPGWLRSLQTQPGCLS